MYRKTWMEIDLDQVESNIKRIKEISQKKLIMVVKADGYGSGDKYIAEAAVNAGAEMLAVSSFDEAVILRNEGYQGKLLVLGHVDPSFAFEIKQHDVAVPAYSLSWVKELIQQDCNGLKVHIKLDTGMNRIGFKKEEELLEAKSLLLEHGCVLEGVFTHFCCTDTSKEFTQTQFNRFEELVKKLDYPFEWIHCDNSDATIFFKDNLSNACRLGISAYGPSPYLSDLKHPISLYTEAFLVKQIQPGETVGYGATYTAEKEEWIATMPIGYADGFIRANQGRKVYVNGTYATIVGRVCMDQTMIRLEEKIEEGSVVELFGSHISLESMAEDLHTIPYEILCLVGARVTRVYKRGNQVIAESNLRLDHSKEA